MIIEVTKQWKQLPYTICTLSIPSIPGILVSSSDVQPVGEDGIKYNGQVVPFYSEKKLCVKIPISQNLEKTNITVENFI